jgi:hypothetical protein
MKKNTTILLIAFTLLFLMIMVLPHLEGFGTSPGTLVQLSSSHVPTEEDEYYLRYIYPRMVNRDLLDMTGRGLY